MNSDKSFEEMKEYFSEQKKPQSLSSLMSQAKETVSEINNDVRDLVDEARETLAGMPRTDNRGRNNLYNCRTCGNTIITVDADEGITPMFLSCDKCSGKMHSMMYNVPPYLVPSCQWIDTGDEVLELKEIPARDKEVPLTNYMSVAQPHKPPIMDCGARLSSDNRSDKGSGQTAFHKKFNKSKKRGK